MSFCRVNGVVLPVVVNEAGQEQMLVEDRSRMEDASLFVDRRAEKAKWTVSLALQTAAYAHAFRRLLHGDGHYMSFDSSVYSSRGLAPQAKNGGTLDNTQVWLGAKSLMFLFSDTGRNISYDALPPNTPTGWTVAYAARITQWDHWLATSTLGASGFNWYKNGVLGFSQSGYSTSISTSVGRVTLQGDVNTTWFDELLILPYAVPPDWIPQIYDFMNPASGNTQWAPLRKVKLDGDIVDDGTKKTVFGSVGKMAVKHTRSAGVKVPKRTLEVELEEV